jgi:hypothetical protein
MAFGRDSSLRSPEYEMGVLSSEANTVSRSGCFCSGETSSLIYVTKANNRASLVRIFEMTCILLRLCRVIKLYVSSWKLITLVQYHTQMLVISSGICKLMNV